MRSASAPGISSISSASRISRAAAPVNCRAACSSVSQSRALLLDPDILLMDEPFSALDALTRDEMAFELLRIWTDRPKTVLFITHAINEALLLADRIIVMTGRPGRVREIIDVPLQRPRSMATLSDPVFLELANHIRARLFSRL